ncbi:M23 family metallopeptidase [bacterium]|nr:M23 family metallopeptidase [bacterium]
MLKKRFRFICLSRNGIDIKQIDFTVRQIYIASSAAFVFLMMVAALILGLSTKLYHNYRITALEKDREKLQHELLTMKERVSQLNSQLTHIESSSDELRTVANLPEINNDIRLVGVGGPSDYAGLDFLNYPDEITETAMEIRLDLDKLERSVQLEKSSLTEIATRLQERQDYYDHLPSIMPIINGTITEDFGFRIHPITNRPQNHKGVDIPSRVGTKVLAAAGGTVIEAKSKYKPNHSYGKEILIDHGNGFCTRYAHLNRILVRAGDKVKRWDTIGEVGETGATTGPHLHYEVMLNTELQNPKYYIFN